MVIGTITESDSILEQAEENKGGMVSVCKALERLEKRTIEQRNEEIVLRMLKKGMGDDLIQEITDADEELIEQLRKKIQM